MSFPQTPSIRRAALLLWLGVLCAPLTTSCAAPSDNMPLIPPAAFASTRYVEQPDGSFDTEVEVTYWKSAAPFFVYGFVYTQLSNNPARGSDFKNIWDRDWNRLLPVDGSRPKGYRKHTVDEPRAFLNYYVIVWESTTSRALKEHRFCGSTAIGENVDRFKLSDCD